jgi:5-oxoprolinase (ATP-hydrolysing)
MWHVFVFYSLSRLLWLQILSSSSLPALPDPATTTQAYFDGLGRVVTPVYMLDDLVGGQQLPGPALLIDNIRCAVAAAGALTRRLNALFTLGLRCCLSRALCMHSHKLKRSPAKLVLHSERASSVCLHRG